MYSFFKRLFDCCAALLGLIICGPLILVAGAAVKISSPGPAVFSQTRIGRGRNPFVCYKLRTMVVGTKQAGTHEVAPSSVTPVGKFLRSTKLDELPQLWNVVCGDMSLVGPRPCLPAQKQLINERLKRGVYDAVPGITGLAQVEGIDMSDPVRLAEKDAEYVRNLSVFGDLNLLFLTVIGRGSGDKIGGNKS